MKSTIALGLTLAASLAGVLAPSSNVMAAPTMHHGSVCHNYDIGQANFFDFFWDGVKNGTAATRYVICPLEVVHTAGQTTGSVYVDAVAPTGGAVINCTLTSYSWTDQFLGSKNGNAPGWLSSVPANTYSNHSVVCSLPASYNGKIVAIEAYF